LSEDFSGPQNLSEKILPAPDFIDFNLPLGHGRFFTFSHGDTR